MAGRPPKYKTAEELQNAIDLYWELLDKSKPTITGLALALGFESRQSFYRYEQDGEFSYTIKKARLRIEEVYEQNLHGNAAAGSIFALKNFGWSDRQELDHTTKGESLNANSLSDDELISRINKILKSKGES